ncbi:MAG: NHLP leader peptide family RiPP precursor, partial [Roseococcus sp.]
MTAREFFTVIATPHARGREAQPPVVISRRCARITHSGCGADCVKDGTAPSPAILTRVLSQSLTNSFGHNVRVIRKPEGSTMPENDTAPDFAKIIAKAWRDRAFKAELIANPAAALKAEGIDVPAGMAVTVLENTDK